MEQETLFTSAKWDILNSLSKAKKSPIELADQYNTSVSNISQSLRFLELGGLVKSERISNRDRGQPRVIYSLNSDKAFVIVAAGNFSGKKMLDLDTHKNIMLKIWFYDDKVIQAFLEEAYFKVKKLVPDLKGLFFDRRTSDIRLLLISKEKTTEKKTGSKESSNAANLPKDFDFEFNGLTRKISFKYSSEKEIEEFSAYVYALYDPDNVQGK